MASSSSSYFMPPPPTSEYLKRMRSELHSLNLAMHSLADEAKRDHAALNAVMHSRWVAYQDYKQQRDRYASNSPGYMHYIQSQYNMARQEQDIQVRNAELKLQHTQCGFHAIEARVREKAGEIEVEKRRLGREARMSC